MRKHKLPRIGAKILLATGLLTTALLATGILAISSAEGAVFFYQEPTQFVMAQARPEEKNPPVLLLAKIMDNFDEIADVVYTWWDGDGTKVYQRSLDSELKRSGLHSLKIDYIKRSGKYKFSFFAFQPKQDRIHNDFSKYERLSLWLYTRAPLELIIKLQDKNKRAFEQKFKLEAKEDWQRIELDLSKAWEVNLAQIDNVFFFAQPGQYRVKGTFWVEDIYLVKTKDIPPTPPETPKNLDYREEGGVFKFSWSDESKSGAAIYEVWLAKDLEFTQPIVFWTNNNFLEFWNEPPEWLYFKVRTWNQLPEYGGKSSPLSKVWAKK